MPNFIIIFSFLLFAGSTGGGAPAELCSRRFQVAVNTHAPQFYRDSENRPQGFTHEVIENLQKHMGCTFIEKDLMRPLAIEQMKAGRLDMALMLFRGPEFESSGDFVLIYQAKRELIVHKSLYAPGKRIHDYLSDKKIIFANFIGSRTALTPQEEGDLYKQRRLLEVADLPSMYDILKRGRVQALMMTAMTNSFFAKRNKIEDQFVRIQDDDVVKDVGLYLSKRRITKAERSKVEKAFEAMRADGSLNKILNTYMPKDAATAHQWTGR